MLPTNGSAESLKEKLLARINFRGTRPNFGQDKRLKIENLQSKGALGLTTQCPTTLIF
jgi:hypothetical protein